MYTADMRVMVYPFTRQIEDDAVIIGRPDTAIFIALPPDAVELLDQLALGKTVGETQTFYYQRYGEVPDLADLLVQLEEQGLVMPLKPNATLADSPDRIAAFESQPGRTPKIKFHLDNFPVGLARFLWSPWMLSLYGGVILLALIAVFLEPAILPDWRARYVTEHITFFALFLIGIGYMRVALHELAHATAARAVGVASRFSIGNRLWVLVAETDLTGLWSLPRNKRYLPFLAGLIFDLFIASILLLLLWGASRNVIALPDLTRFIFRAILLSCILGVIWQFYFFLRTDLYYVIVNFFGCKNLIEDTWIYLKNHLLRVFKVPAVDQSHIPAAEQRVIHFYSFVWVIGRMLALWVFFTFVLPLLWNYTLLVIQTISAGYGANPYAFIDVLAISLTFLLPQSIALFLWIRSLMKRRK